MKNSTYLYGQAEASKNVIGGIGGSGGSGGIGGSRGIGGNRGSGGIGGSRGTGDLSTGGGVTGVTGGSTGVEDLEQKDMGWAGSESRGSTEYISVSNILNMSLRFLGGPAAPPHPGPLPETLA